MEICMPIALALHQYGGDLKLYLRELIEVYTSDGRVGIMEFLEIDEVELEQLIFEGNTIWMSLS